MSEARTPLEAALREAGLPAGATIQSVQRRFGVDVGHAMRLLAVREAALAAVPPAPEYDPTLGDARRCQCGHAYYRHFDTYEGMAPVGCKYCPCGQFEAVPPAEPAPDPPSAGPMRRLHIAFNVATRREGGRSIACDGAECRICEHVEAALAAVSSTGSTCLRCGEKATFWMKDERGEGAFCGPLHCDAYFLYGAAVPACRRWRGKTMSVKHWRCCECGAPLNAPSSMEPAFCPACRPLPAPAEGPQPQCTGKSSDAYDCPVHDPRKRAEGPQPEEDGLLSPARVRELLDKFGITDTDLLKHRLEDEERWNREKPWLTGYPNALAEAESRLCEVEAELDAERASFRAQIDNLWNSHAALQQRVARLSEALADIADPLAKIRAKAEAEGMQLDGNYAVQLANDARWLRDKARAALAAETGEDK